MFLKIVTYIKYCFQLCYLDWLMQLMTVIAYFHQDFQGGKCNQFQMIYSYAIKFFLKTVLGDFVGENYTVLRV